MMIGIDQYDDVHHLRLDQLDAFNRGEVVLVDCGDDGVRRIVALLPPIGGCHEGPIGDVDDTWPDAEG